MGVALWLACGAAAFLVARIIPFLRSAQKWPEAVCAIVTALAAGFVATALDFGGWNELDWRGTAFALLCALAACGVVRFVRAVR
jgi:hypothetical protein